MSALITLTNATVTRSGKRLIGPLSLELAPGRHLALLGPNGSGKTTLLRLLRGEVPPDDPACRIYALSGEVQQTPLGIRQRLGLVSADMQDFYSLHASRLTGRSLVLSGFFDAPLLYEEVDSEQEAAADSVLGRLGVEDLASAEVGTLSTGQLRKLLIGRALVASPQVLLLDECLEGLDACSRTEVLALLDTLACDITLVAAVHRPEDLPQCVRRVVVLEQGAIRAETEPEQLAELVRPVEPRVDSSIDTPSPPQAEFLLRMNNVSVVAGGRRILRDVNWEIRPGEHWLVLGENGAGKSTLMRVAVSELAPYADGMEGTGTVERLGGMTMDEARPRMGVVSPALQTRYARELGWEVTVLETVLSGFRGSVGMLDAPTVAETATAGEWLARVGLADAADRPLRSLSYGQQRRVFLARAMVGDPWLLLLDEPMAGLDPASRVRLLGLVQAVAEGGTPVVLVTHHVEDRVPAVNRVLELEAGRIVFRGTRSEFEASQVGTALS